MATRKKARNYSDVPSEKNVPSGTRVQSILSKKLEGGNVLYKVRWEGQPESAATWQAKHTIPGCESLIARFEKANPNMIEEEQWEVESILRKRVVRGQTTYLTKWKGWSDKSNEWLTRDCFADNFLVDAFEIREAVTGFRRKITKKLEASDFDDEMYEMTSQAPDGEVVVPGERTNRPMDDDE
jgi:hypothetical protein